MNLSDIALLRLNSQQLAQSRLTTPGEVVRYMGAMQSQDYPMAKWAVGLRTPESTDGDIETALSNGEILRTHILRPTWHFVSAEDIYWIIDLTAAQLKSAFSYRDKQLELTREIFALSNKVIEKTLSDGGSHTREELIRALNQAGIATDENRASHLFARAEIVKLICSGITHNNKTTYALLSVRVPKARLLPRNESLAELARRYFTSRAPATLQDFIWWSGLPARDANLALELVKSEFRMETIDGRNYWLAPDTEEFTSGEKSVYLLPDFDELSISYADRSASITEAASKHMNEISDRGVFRPILVIDGRVAGIWKRTIKKDLLTLEVRPFSQLDPQLVDRIKLTAESYARFSGKQLDFQIQD